MVKAVDFHAMSSPYHSLNHSGSGFSIWFFLKRCLYFAAVLHFLLGCLSTQQAANPDELLLSSLSPQGPAADFAQTGRQGASLQMTVEGRERLRAGQLDEAISRFQKAISLSSSNPFAYYYFGEARYLKREYQQSLSLLERAEIELYSLARDPVWLARVHVLRGKNYEALSRFDEAKGQYQQALAVYPQSQDAREGIQRLGYPGDVQ